MAWSSNNVKKLTDKLIAMKVAETEFPVTHYADIADKQITQFITDHHTETQVRFDRILRCQTQGVVDELCKRFNVFINWDVEDANTVEYCNLVMDVKWDLKNFYPDLSKK